MHIGFPPVIQALLGCALLALAWNFENAWGLIDDLWLWVSLVSLGAAVLIWVRYQFDVQFLSWAWHKVPEIPWMRSADLLMAAVVADIHRKNTGQRKVFVPLGRILPIHPIDRGPAEEKALARRDVALANRQRFLKQHVLSEEFLNSFDAWTSVTGICVVRGSGEDFYSFEGNGRLYALCTAFPEKREWCVEATEFLFTAADLAAIQSGLRLTREQKGMPAH